MFVQTIKMLVDIVFTIAKIPLFILAAFFALFGVCCLVQYARLYRSGYRLPPIKKARVTRSSAFHRLFVEAPRRILLDMQERDPDFFTYQGLHVFCGEQGSGKTIAMVEMMMRIQKQFPQALCITNFGYVNENEELTDWRQLLTYSNGQKGVIVGMDELQNWFASGKNTLPEQMLEVVTQNRKNRRIILGTSQVFTRMAKGLREQCTLVYEPLTIAGVITWVRVKKPVLDFEGNVLKKVSRGSYFFVHTPELREAYDTYKVISSLASAGFKERPMEVTTNVTNVVVAGKRR